MKPLAERPYRPGVGIMLLNPASEVFVGQRIDTPADAWQMPQGGIDAGEEPLVAAWREMKEEVGTDHAELVAESREWLHYDLPAELADRIWKGRFRGQRQKWFAFRFLGSDRDIRIDTRHPEFRAWRWAALAELPSLIVPFKRQLYADLLVEFAGLLPRASR